MRHIIDGCRRYLPDWFAPAPLALALVVIGTAIVLSRDWLKALSVPLLFAGNGTTVLLVTILAIYLALLVAAAFGVVVLGWLVWRSQRNNRPSPGSRLRLTRRTLAALVRVDRVRPDDGGGRSGCLAVVDSPSASVAAPVCRVSANG